MKKLPKVIPAHTPVAFALRGVMHYAQHTPSCGRGKSRLQVTDGYDHEAQAFRYRWVTAKQIVGIGERAIKPSTPEDVLFGGSIETDEVKTTEALKKRYRHNFQKRDEEQGALDEDREINIKLDKRAMRRWLKQSEKARNNSPMPPQDTKMPKRIVRKLARKRYHGALTLKALIKKGALKL